MVRSAAAAVGLSRGAVFRMAEADPESRLLYSRARSAQAHCLAEEALTLADSARGMDADGVRATALAVDTRKWYTSKIAPKLFGDRLDVDVQARHAVTVRVVEAYLPLPQGVTARIVAGDDDDSAPRNALHAGPVDDATPRADDADEETERATREGA